MTFAARAWRVRQVARYRQAVVYGCDNDEEEMILSAFIKSGGYAGVALVLACGVLGCGAFPHRTEAQKQADKETASRVQDALDGDHILYAKHIVVHAEDGVVELSGYVWATEDIYEAQRVAEDTTGVARVVNNLELQRNGMDNSPSSR